MASSPLKAPQVAPSMPLHWEWGLNMSLGGSKSPQATVVAIKLSYFIHILSFLLSSASFSLKVCIHDSVFPLTDPLYNPLYRSKLLLIKQILFLLLFVFSDRGLAIQRSRRTHGAVRLALTSPSSFLQTAGLQVPLTIVSATES